MVTPAQFRTYIENTVAQVCPNYVSVRLTSAISPIIQEIALEARIHNTHSLIGCITGEGINMANASSQLTHLYELILLDYFRTHFPQRNPWRLIQLTSKCIRKLNIMMHSKSSPKDSTQQSPKKTQRTGNSGTYFAAGSTSPLTSKVLKILYPSSRHFPSICTYEFYMQGGAPINNISVEKYLWYIGKNASVGADYTRKTQLDKINFYLGH